MAEAVKRARLRSGGIGTQGELRLRREKSPSGELVGGDSLQSMCTHFDSLDSHNKRSQPQSILLISGIRKLRHSRDVNTYGVSTLTALSTQTEEEVVWVMRC